MTIIIVGGVWFLICAKDILNLINNHCNKTTFWLMSFVHCHYCIQQNCISAPTLSFTFLHIFGPCFYTKADRHYLSRESGTMTRISSRKMQDKMPNTEVLLCNRSFLLIIFLLLITNSNSITKSDPLHVVMCTNPPVSFKHTITHLCASAVGLGDLSQCLSWAGRPVLESSVEVGAVIRSAHTGGTSGGEELSPWPLQNTRRRRVEGTPSEETEKPTARFTLPF